MLIECFSGTTHVLLIFHTHTISFNLYHNSIKLIRKLKLRDVKQFAQGHTGQLIQWQFQILTDTVSQAFKFCSTLYDQNTRNICPQLYGDRGKNTQVYILNTKVSSSKPVNS